MQGEENLEELPQVRVRSTWCQLNERDLGLFKKRKYFMRSKISERNVWGLILFKEKQKSNLGLFHSSCSSVLVEVWWNFPVPPRVLLPLDSFTA